MPYARTMFPSHAALSFLIREANFGNPGSLPANQSIA